MDEETGLYYYGARYYDEQTSIWLRVDPLAAEKYPNISPYVFCVNNPINIIDPNGLEVINADEANRDKKQAALNDAQVQHRTNLKNRNISGTEGMSRREMKEAGVWTSQKGVNKAQRQFNKAEKTFTQTQTAINDLKNNDPDTFNNLVNQCYNERDMMFILPVANH